MKLLRRSFYAVLVTFFGFGLGQELSFEANGEDFVRQGFVSKDGWQIDFEHVFVNLSEIRAYQTDPPFEADSELTSSANMVGLPGSYYVDLAEGDEDAAPVTVGTVSASEGFYNALSWEMAPNAGSPTLQLSGTASKDGETVAFTISSFESFAYDCGTFIGDERKGIVGDTGGVVELTFHFDHIFGDIDLSPDDSLNQDALGFSPFAALAENGELNLETGQGSQLTEEDSRKLSTLVLPNLGHVGEGHCFERSTVTP